MVFLTSANSLPKYQEVTEVMKVTKAAGMNMFQLWRSRWSNGFFIPFTLCLATVLTMTSGCFIARPRLWQTCSSLKPSKTLKELLKLSILLFAGLQPEVIWLQKSPNHHRWSLEYTDPRSSYQGRSWNIIQNSLQIINQQKNLSKGIPKPTYSCRSWKSRLD